MSNKPKIYASCKAGCNWETIHRGEFETSFPYVEIRKDRTNGFTLKKGVKYKIFNSSNESYVFNLKIRLGNNTITIPNPKFNEFSDYIFFKLLDVKLTQNYKTQIIYELNDEVLFLETFTEGFADISRFLVYYNQTTRSLNGSHTSYFTYTDKEVADEEKRVYVDFMVKTTYDMVNTMYRTYRWIAGDTGFVEEWELNYDYKVSKLKWKNTYTDSNNITYTFNESGDVQYHNNANSTSSEKCIASASAVYTGSTHYEVDTYSWQEVVGNRTLVGQEDDGTTFYGYYHQTSETDIDTSNYECYVVNTDRVLIVNDAVNVSVESNGAELKGDLQGGEIVVGYDQGTIKGSGIDINDVATKEYVDNNAGGVIIYTPIREE